MKNNITLLIHGPLGGHNLLLINKNLSALKYSIPIIIACYVTDYELYKKEVEKYKFIKHATFVLVKDTLNPGFCNINRQIISVKSALDYINEDQIVIKLRNDQSISFLKVIKYINKYNLYSINKILTTNCYTRKDRLYHPSDMFLCGSKKVLADYYACEEMEETEDIHIFNEIQQHKEKFKTSLTITPESYLFRNFIIKNEWKIKETNQDSISAIKHFCIVVNSWNIDYRWIKTRNPFLSVNSIILPYYENYVVWNAIKEKSSCFMEHEINSTLITIKDIYYILLSKLLFGLKRIRILTNIIRLFRKKKIHKLILKLIIKILLIFLAFMPFFLVKSTVKKLKAKLQNIKLQH